MSLSYTVSVFHDLIERYPTWEQLRAYLESNDGGSLHVTDASEDEHLVLIRYVKETSSFEKDHVRWFRSVIWDTRIHRPVSIAPPRSTSTPCVPSEANEGPYFVEEFLDGFMIQGYRCVLDNGEWGAARVATRSKLDASGTFYSSKPFHVLFTEALASDGTVEECIPPWNETNVIAVSYSFVTQHSENRQVTPVATPRVFLIQRVTVEPSGQIQVEDHFETFRGRPNMGTLPEIALDSLDDSVRTYLADKPWSFQGIVIKDQHGHRWKYCTDGYTMVKGLRGNYPKTLNRFAYLYTQNLTDTYLQYYPEDTFLFSFHTVCMKNLVDRLHHLYLQIYVWKSILLEDVDRMYHPHLYALHKLYRNTLRPAKRHLTLADLYTYFHGQPWQRISFLIRKIQDTYFSQVQQAVESDKE